MVIFTFFAFTVVFLTAKAQKARKRLVPLQFSLPALPVST
jgi:hypothetical protein